MKYFVNLKETHHYRHDRFRKTSRHYYDKQFVSFDRPNLTEPKTNCQLAAFYGFVALTSQNGNIAES